LRSSTLLSEVLPEYDFRERHARRIDAPPERVFAAVRELSADDTPAVRLLFRLRGLRGETARPIFDQMERFGFEVVAEEPGRELEAIQSSNQVDRELERLKAEVGAGDTQKQLDS